MGPPTRKRNRKRKRRVLSDSSSSSSSASSSDASTPHRTVTAPVSPAKQPTTDQLSSSSDGSDSDMGDVDVEQPAVASSTAPPPERASPSPSPSPSPPPTADIPPFVPPDSPEGERALKEKFRKFWMASIAEGFKDDLEEIRKEPNFGPSRLALLIESLASGADVFSASGGVNEMEVVLEHLP